MKFWEAVKELQEGRANKIKNADNSLWITIEEVDEGDTQLVWGNGEKYHGSWLNDEWVINEKPKTLEKVYQWRYRPTNSKPGGWKVDTELYTKKSAKIVYTHCVAYEQHAGPFEVEE